VVVLNDLSEAKGGASAIALLCAMCARQSGVPVTLLAGDQGQNAELETAGVSIVSLGRKRLRSANPIEAFARGIYNRDARRMVSAWIKNNDTPRTIYHLHGWAQILSPSVFAALEPVRDRLILSAHDFFLTCPNGAYFNYRTSEPCVLVPLSWACRGTHCDRRSYAEKLWRVTRQALQRHFSPASDSPPVLVVHQAMIPSLVRGGIREEVISVLLNPVIPWTQTRIQAERNSQLLFVGRLEETKGPDLALAAARRAGAQLKLIGDGSMRSLLEQRYPEMLFMGSLPHTQIGEHAAKARLLLMPSRYPEPFGLAAVEALWSGLPAIVPPSASLAQDVVATGCGLRADPKDCAAYSNVIRAALADDEHIKSMSCAGFEKNAALALSSSEWCERLISVYASRLQ